MAAVNMGAVTDPEINEDGQVPEDEVGAGAAGAEPDEEETGRWWRRSGRLWQNPAGNWRRRGRLISQDK